jgi:hypothetical protein
LTAVGFAVTELNPSSLLDSLGTHSFALGNEKKKNKNQRQRTSFYTAKNTRNKKQNEIYPEECKCEQPFKLRNSELS